MGMILENENTFLGGLVADIKRILVSIFCIAFITGFLLLLVAPALIPIFCRDLIEQTGSGSIEQMLFARRQLKTIRIVLWVSCILAWIATLLILAGYNLSNY